MGSDFAAEVVQATRNSSCVKAHYSICSELTKVVDKITSILPAIESARPGCIAGIQELCSLNNTIAKAKLLIQHCTESSKLYLAITGESIVLRCERMRSALSRSLFLIQNMVPQTVAAQISVVLDYLGDVKFIIDSTEEEAGKAMLELLRQTEASEEFEFKAFQIAAARLSITSPKALLVERRSIKKLLEKIHGTDPKKEGILNLFLHLIKKYGRKVREDIVEHREDGDAQGKCFISSTISAPTGNDLENSDEPTNHGEARTDSSNLEMPPEELCCPISSRLMYDPVVIASGETFERIAIERWFSDGHDTCPKTQKKLAHFTMIPNSCMKELISNWCINHGISLEDPSSPSQSWDSSRSISISSLKNVSAALLDGRSGEYVLQSDNSNVSFISSDASYCSDSSHVRGIEGSTDNERAKEFSWSDDYLRFLSFSNFSHDMYLKFFYSLSELPLDLQDKAVEDMKALLEGDYETCYVMLSNGFAEALMVFLKNAHTLCDVQAQKTGARIFLAFLSNNRVELPSLSEESFHLLTSFLESEIVAEALMILQKFSRNPNYNSGIVLSVLPHSIVEILDSEHHELLELAVSILYDLSCHREIRSQILSSGCIPKLVPLLDDRRLAELCVKIIRNLSDFEEAAVLIAETNGFLAAIAELLETGSQEEREHGVAILHSLCSRSLDYCPLVMKEGVIPSLVHISVNGNAEGRENAMKLLHLLRDFRNSGSFETSETLSRSVSELAAEDSIDPSVGKQPTSKPSGFFGRKMRFFSKHRSLTLF